MKKYFYGVLVAALVVSCSPENKEATSTQAKSDTAATTATTVTTVTTESAGTTATALTTATIAATPAETKKETTATPAATATTTQASATKAVVSAKPGAKPAEGKKTMSYQDKVVDMKTSKGTITIRFFPDTAPNHVKNFIDLAEKGFYNGTKFHRVIPGFMIQGGDPNTISGDPNTWGIGGSSKNIKAEFNNIHHARGIVSMARSTDPDSASSQFFICVADAASLDHSYSAFGQVTKGMEVADEIVNAPRGRNDRPNQPASIESITVRAATAAEKALPPPAGK